MNSRRKGLMIPLVLLVALLFVGTLGTVEVTIWLILVITWLYAFFVWAKNDRVNEAPTKGKIS